MYFSSEIVGDIEYFFIHLPIGYLYINRLNLMRLHMSRYILYSLLLACLAFIPYEGLKAEETTKAEQTTKEVEGKEKFKPGDFIFEHIGDAYEWHIFSFKSLDIALPLPVILYSKTTGMHIFISNKFHHGASEYQGFKIAEEGTHKGKIVEICSGSEVRPIDLSITKNVFALFISISLMLYVFLKIAGQYKKREGKAPKGIQSFFEPIILFVRDDIARPAIGEEKYERYMPYLLSIFFFIWFNNMIGLIPLPPVSGANVTGNISITLVLALFTFLITTFSGNKHYWTEIFNDPGVPWWLKFPIPLMPIIELSGMITKPFVLMVRLFANISAGHIIGLGFFSLIFIFGQMQPLLGYAVSPLSVVFTIFMSMLELLVALIQAYVFTLLSALYFGMATAEPHGSHAEH
jgi:F-type H+-transporting ATPase subunit a